MSQTSKRSLGRGFDALISDDFDKSLLLESGERVEKIPLDQLKPNPYQPRQHFEDQALRGLAASIRQHGIVQPLVVTPLKNGSYQLVAGERRWRAAALAKLKTVPAIIRTTEKLEQLELALIENVQRVDLSPLEQAASIESLHHQFSLSYDEIAKRLGKATSTVHNIIRLLGLPPAARDALVNQKISEGHARAVLALKGDSARQAYLLQAIIDQGWSVRQAERFVTSVKSGVKQTKEAHARTDTETPATKQLSKKLGTPVHVRRMARGGKLEITFASDDELDKLINHIGQLK
ncbi:MAG TPA: ParB/RepB/Spo0J family partition protein [Candidatus Dormibacteraeota bacterium]|nr:ParB/RepB/Spo0J family partition protein [Candidatus Dormibacteraeota bacterium]